MENIHSSLIFFLIVAGNVHQKKPHNKLILQSSPQKFHFTFHNPIFGRMVHIGVASVYDHCQRPYYTGSTGSHLSLAIFSLVNTMEGDHSGIPGATGFFLLLETHALLCHFLLSYVLWHCNWKNPMSGNTKLDEASRVRIFLHLSWNCETRFRQMDVQWPIKHVHERCKFDRWIAY